MSISPQRGKQNRPFVGVVVMTNERKYCIPLTSSKDKFKNRKSQVGFIKVYDLVTKIPEKSRNLVRRSSDFIKLEKIADEYEQKEFIMANTDKTAVEIEWKLDTPVRDDIYRYIVNE